MSIQHSQKQMLAPEIEAKFEFLHLYHTVEAFRNKLTAIHAICAKPERLLRITIFHPRDNPGISVSYIRVRDESDRITLSAKIHPATNEGPATQAFEAETMVDSYEHTIQILIAAGLTPSVYHEKKRETWELDGSSIEIDTWPFTEPYCEIESPDEHRLQATVMRLGFRYEDKIIRPASYLLHKRYPHLGDEKTMLRKIEHLTFAGPDPFIS